VAKSKVAAAPSKKVPPAKKAAPAPAQKAAAARPVAKKPTPAPAKSAAPAKKAAPPKKSSSSAPVVIELPAVKGVTKDGVAYTKDFDVKFLTTMRALLLEEKAALTGQATRLEDEANSLIEEQEMGDVQFDDEGGEGDTMVVERERDLTLSAQARQTIADIDTALGRLATGQYGYSTESGRPIPRERLEAIPWATMLVEEKVGGIGRR
jgi:RNA polymerase-binding transcription factor DksA